MQDQVISLSSLQIISIDTPLIQLFQLSQQNAELPPILQEHVPLTLQDIAIAPSDIQKAYASQEQQPHISRRKMIRRKKPNFIKEHPSKSMRTKLYIQSLENRINQLETQVQKLRGINKLNIQYIKKINDSQLIINGFFMDRQKILARIQKLTDSNNPDQRRIRMQCLALKAKQGANGEDRIKAIDYYFKQLVEMIVPNSHRYLTHAALSNSDVFNAASFNQAQQWKKDLFYQINFSQQCLSYISLSRKQILEVQVSFNDVLCKMQDNKMKLMQLTKKIDGILDKINEHLTPIQTGRLFCYLEKYKFQNNFQVQYSSKTKDDIRINQQEYDMNKQE